MDELITARSHLKSSNGKIDPRAATPVFLSAVSLFFFSAGMFADNGTGPRGTVPQASRSSGLQPFPPGSPKGGLEARPEYMEDRVDGQVVRATSIIYIPPSGCSRFHLSQSAMNSASSSSYCSRLAFSSSVAGGNHHARLLVQISCLGRYASLIASSSADGVSRRPSGTWSVSGVTKYRIKTGEAQCAQKRRSESGVV
jgi:hypothetical protein